MTKNVGRRSYKKLILNPKYQFKYIFLMGASALFLGVVNGTVFYVFTRENYEILVDLAPMTDAVKSQLHGELNQVTMYLGVFTLVFTFAASVLSLILSHRTVGPLYHFKRVFNEIRMGERSSRIRLRPRDEFGDVAAAFNEMMDALPLEKSETERQPQPVKPLPLKKAA